MTIFTNLPTELIVQILNYSSNDDIAKHYFAPASNIRKILCTQYCPISMDREIDWKDPLATEPISRKHFIHKILDTEIEEFIAQFKMKYCRRIIIVIDLPTTKSVEYYNDLSRRINQLAKIGVDKMTIDFNSSIQFHDTYRKFISAKHLKINSGFKYNIINHITEFDNCNEIEKNKIVGSKPSIIFKNICNAIIDIPYDCNYVKFENCIKIFCSVPMKLCGIYRSKYMTIINDIDECHCNDVNHINLSDIHNELIICGSNAITGIDINKCYIDVSYDIKFNIVNKLSLTDSENIVTNICDGKLNIGQVHQHETSEEEAYMEMRMDAMRA